jgi:uncharacterized protein
MSAPNNDECSVASVVTDLRVEPSVDTEVAAEFAVRMMMTGPPAKGFWAGEVVPPPPEHVGGSPRVWKVIQRFCSAENAIAWQKSEMRKQIIQQMSDTTGGGITVSDSTVLADALSEVSTAIVTEVFPGKEEEFFQWQAKINAAQAKHKGYRGAYLQAPAPGIGSKWATLLRFDSPAALEGWFASEQRTQLLAEAANLLKRWQISRVPSSYPGWFPTDQATGAAPAKWKTFLMVLLGLFPAIIIEQQLVGSALDHLPMPIAIFLRIMGSVAATTWITMPICIKAFAWWLIPKENPVRTNFLGVGIICLIFAIEIGLSMLVAGF